MTQADIQILLDNKREYMDHLYEVAIPALMQEFQDIYSKVSAKSNGLQEFQSSLVVLPEWNSLKVTEAYERFVERSGCSYFSDLIRGIMITVIKINTAGMDDKSKVKIRVPSSENFLHRCIVACARSVWKKPYLFYHNVRSIERQHNMGILEDLFRKAINSTIRACLPMEQLLRQVAGDHKSSSESETSSEDETEPSEDEEDEEEEEDDVEEEDLEEEEDVVDVDKHIETDEEAAIEIETETESIENVEDHIPENTIIVAVDPTAADANEHLVAADTEAPASLDESDDESFPDIVTDDEAVPERVESVANDDAAEPSVDPTMSEPDSHSEIEPEPSSSNDVVVDIVEEEPIPANIRRIDTEPVITDDELVTLTALATIVDTPELKKIDIVAPVGRRVHKPSGIKKTHKPRVTDAFF